MSAAARTDRGFLEATKPRAVYLFGSGSSRIRFRADLAIHSRAFVAARRRIYSRFFLHTHLVRLDGFDAYI
jgi:hypothetical protein